DREIAESPGELSFWSRPGTRRFLRWIGLGALCAAGEGALVWILSGVVSSEIAYTGILYLLVPIVIYTAAALGQSDSPFEDRWSWGFADKATRVLLANLIFLCLAGLVIGA